MTSNEQTKIIQIGMQSVPITNKIMISVHALERCTRYSFIS